MSTKVKGPFSLPPLPWEESALEPAISARTLQLHHGKHHRGYVEKLNELVADTPFADVSLEQVILKAAGREEYRKIFNNAAQAWNHEFFWNALRPKGGGKPTGELASRLEKDLGGYESFKKQLATAAIEHFGSGWVWLVQREGKLAIETTANADLPSVTGGKPLLTIDLWEHAYYLDYENRRPEFVAAMIDNLVNWEFAHEQLEGRAHRKAA